MVSPRQKQYLDAMGVPTWRLREPLSGEQVDAVAAAEAEVQSVAPVVTAVEVVEPAPPMAEVVTSSPVIDCSSYSWAQLQQSVQQCVACGLHETRTQTVFGSGDQSASWMFVGEAPGADEDQQGQPFVGRAGQLLTSMIQALKMSREQVYIANVLKCRPPNNRDPHIDEVAHCEAYLQRQVALVQPKVIVALGRIAAQNLLKTDESLGKLRGRVFQYGDQQIPLIVTYHPAYLLRTPGDKRKTWQDLSLAKQIIKSRS